MLLAIITDKSIRRVCSLWSVRNEYASKMLFITIQNVCLFVPNKIKKSLVSLFISWYHCIVLYVKHVYSYWLRHLMAS